MEDNLEFNRRRSRRRMAIISFACLICMAITIFSGAWLAGPEFADSVEKMSGVLDMILLVFASIVLGYLGFSAFEATKRN